MPDILEEIELHLSQHSRHTRAGHLRLFRRFLANNQPEPEAWTPEAALAFLQTLRDQGWKTSSVQTAAIALRTLYRIYGRPWPEIPRGTFAVDILAQERPALSLDELQRLVPAALASPWPELAAMAALSTIYGFRGGEIGSLNSSHLNLQERRIMVATGKGGAPRIHGLPDGIVPVLHPEHFGRPRSLTEMWGWWRDLEHRARIARRPRQGWHAVRRGVTIALLDAGVPEYVLEPWMGWREALKRSVRRYGLRGRPDLDAEVFSRHPVLPVWAEFLKR
jgi:hypothetical protein